ncbi:hypothetical protein PCH_Pc21g07820 [Penicillium rubens Wisconsin 54-1255]|uniref:Uncharacterized protein n=1 Tax=Penicillium rubens (strain ATCC 28089 / DSM 1075 / NRRL 1951 / Wisconsin 54-1255) TaxID=500485 RepID=B6HL76_PENRW|nr:hypothetical protein PCH_Pc21g07820 [Penicillium rubens Wisconsin 54-1255]
MSNSRPTLLSPARRSPTMIITQRRGTGDDARAQYITWMGVEYGFVSRSLVDLDRDPGAEAALRFSVHDPTGEEKEQVVSTEYQLQVLGIHWNIGPITTSRSGRRVHPFMAGTSEIDDRNGERAGILDVASLSKLVGDIEGYDVFPFWEFPQEGMEGRSGVAQLPRGRCFWTI